MGNNLEKVKDDEEACNSHKGPYDVKRIYWDAHGNLRHGRTERNRDEEVIQMLQTDSNDEKDFTRLWMIVPSRWVRKWLLFSHFKIGEPPGPIDMWSLLKQDPLAPSGNGWRPKNTLLPPSTKFGDERPGHYRRITLEAWINLVELYNVDGPALAVRGTPYDDLTRWRVFLNPKIIDINLLPEPIEFVEEVKVEPTLASGVADAVGKMTGALGSLFGGGGNKDKDNKATAAPPTAAATAGVHFSSSDQWLFQSEAKWDKEWKSGAWDYMEKVAVERSKVSIIGGVLIQMYSHVNASVLDVGCGEGPISDFLTPAQKTHYVGIDISKEAILSAKRLRGPPLKFVHATSHLFQPKNKFDVIIFSDMLYYVEYEKVIKQYEGYLNPGGIVIISIFSQVGVNYDNIWNFARKTFNQLDEMDISGTTKKKKDGVKEKTSFHVEVYKLKET